MNLEENKFFINKNDKLLENYLLIYNQKNEVKIDQKDLEQIEINLKKIIFSNRDLDDLDKKRVNKIRHYLLFLIGFCSNYLSNPEYNILDKFLNNEKNNDIFGSFGKTESFKKFIETLNFQEMNKYFLISQYKIENNKIQLFNKDLKNFYLELFENIFLMRTALVHNDDFLSKNKKNFNASTGIISLLMISNFFSNNIFSILNNEYKQIFNLDSDSVEQKNLNLIQKIANFVLKCNHEYKSTNEYDVFIKFDKNYFDEKIIEFEKQFNINEYEDFYKNNEIKSKWEISQKRNYYIKFFTNMSFFNFNVENLLFNDLKLLKKVDVINKKSYEIKFNKEIFYVNSILEEQEKKTFSKIFENLKKFFDGSRHHPIYILDNRINKTKNEGKNEEETWLFLQIYNEIILNLNNLKKELKKIKNKNWFIPKDISEYSSLIWFNKNKHNNKIVNENFLLNYKADHKGIVISQISRLIKNFENQIFSFNNKNFIFEKILTENLQEKKIRLFNKSDINKKPQEIKKKYNDILERHFLLNDDLKNKVDEFKDVLLNSKQNKFIKNKRKYFKEWVQKTNLDNVIFEDKNEIKIQYIKVKNINKEFENKDTLFKFLTEQHNDFNLSELFKYYSNILHKEVNNSNFTMKDDLENLITIKQAIKLNLKFSIYDSNSFVENRSEINENIVRNFYENVIIKRIKESENYEDYKNKLEQKYKDLGLKFTDKNKNLIFYNIYKTSNEEGMTKFYKGFKANSFDEVIFYTYVKKHSIDFSSSKLFKKNILEILNSENKNKKKIDFLLEILKIDEFLDFSEKGKYNFNKSFNFKDYKKKNERNIEQEIKNKNMIIGKFLVNLSGKNQKFIIKYKIKSNNLILSDFIEIPNIEKGKFLKLDRTIVNNIITIFKQNSSLLQENMIIYNELLDKYKKDKRRKLIFENIKVKDDQYSILMTYNEPQFSYIKIKETKASENNYFEIKQEFENNSFQPQLSLNDKTYFYVKVPKIFDEIIENFKTNN